MLNPKVDKFIERNQRWQTVIAALRAQLLAAKLDEEIKWGQPVYCSGGKNIAIIQCFKESCCLGFFKGVLLHDPKKSLEAQGENSQSMRVLRFTDDTKIKKLQPTIKAFIKNAIANEEAGLKPALKKPQEHQKPAELILAFEKNKKLKTAFEALTPGRQRAYILHFSSAKQAATRVARIEKLTPRILQGKGILDRD